MKQHVRLNPSPSWDKDCCHKAVGMNECMRKDNNTEESILVLEDFLTSF